MREREGEGGEIVVEWRKLLNEKLRYLCSSNIIRVIKSRSKKWAGFMPCRRKNTYAYEILVGKPEGE